MNVAELLAKKFGAAAKEPSAEDCIAQVLRTMRNWNYVLKESGLDHRFSAEQNETCRITLYHKPASKEKTAVASISAEVKDKKLITVDETFTPPQRDIFEPTVKRAEKATAKILHDILEQALFDKEWNMIGAFYARTQEKEAAQAVEREKERRQFWDTMNGY